MSAVGPRGCRNSGLTRGSRVLRLPAHILPVVRRVSTLRTGRNTARERCRSSWHPAMARPAPTTRERVAHVARPGLPRGVIARAGRVAEHARSRRHVRVDLCGEIVRHVRYPPAAWAISAPGYSGISTVAPPVSRTSDAVGPVRRRRWLTYAPPCTAMIVLLVGRVAIGGCGRRPILRCHPHGTSHLILGHRHHDALGIRGRRAPGSESCSGSSERSRTGRNAEQSRHDRRGPAIRPPGWVISETRPANWGSTGRRLHSGFRRGPGSAGTVRAGADGLVSAGGGVRMRRTRAHGEAPFGRCKRSSDGGAPWNVVSVRASGADRRRSPSVIADAGIRWIQ